MSEAQNDQGLAIFEQKDLRRLWHKGEWYWSIIDVIAILTDSPQPRVYWSQLKERVKNVEGFDEALVQIEQLRLKAPDGRFRLTDTANRQTLCASYNLFHRRVRNHSAYGWLRSAKNDLKKSSIPKQH